MKAAVRAKELTEGEKDGPPLNDAETFEFACVRCGVVVPGSQPLDVSLGDDSASGECLRITLAVPVPEEDEKLSNDVHLIWVERQGSGRFWCESCKGLG